MQSKLDNMQSKKSAHKYNVIIVTDLDGTLLDHHTYSWQAAKPALDQAKNKNIPIIPCTSKTLEETQKLIKTIGLDGPIIFENGSGIALADGSLIDLAPKYSEIVEKLETIKLANNFNFWGFDSMRVEDVMAQTQLSFEDAANAKSRRYSEPFLWQGDEKSFNDFEHSCQEVGIDIVRGGRFYHALNRNVTKQRAIEHLKDYLKTPNAHVIALGDSNNDIPMLQNADTAIVVNNPTRSFPHLPKANNDVHYTSAYGPKGWNDAIINLLNNNGE